MSEEDLSDDQESQILKSQYKNSVVWYPALCGAFKLELREYIPDKVKLIYNHQLTKQPLQFNTLVVEADGDAKMKKGSVRQFTVYNKVLIAKVRNNVEIKKGFARNFKKHNLVEYKSSKFPISIYDYYKTQGYCWMYAAMENNVSIKDISMTLVLEKQNRNFLNELKKDSGITSDSPGIYSVNKSDSKTQVIVINELPEDDNIWLTSLRNNLNTSQLKRLQAETAPYKDHPLVSAYLNVIFKANL
ncbi:MAG: hypothetical protein LBK06_04140 [Planctomycetaceae bacterium]|jgi:ribosomal protein S8|nr:hypothetical protein [Planctomycetaceae bacterium]